MPKEKKRFRVDKESLHKQIREHKKTFALYVLLRGLVILIMVLQFFNGNYENVFFCALTLFLFMVPSFLQLNFHIELPDTLEIIILLFIFAAEILGEIRSYYTLVPMWDTMLHTVNGFLCAAVGFSLVELLNRNNRVPFSLSPFFLAVVAFCFSMTIGVLWEFYEFFADYFFHTDMQKDFVVTTINSVLFDPQGLNRVVHVPIESIVVNGVDWMEKFGGYIDIGIIDTMKDLFVNFIGAAVFSIIGYFYEKSKGKGKFARRFIPKVKE